MKGRLDGYSFSTDQKAEQCPARVHYAKIQRLPDPAGPAAERGLQVHSSLEKYGKGEEALPTGLLRWRPMLDDLRRRCEGQFFPEYEVALTRAAWRRTTWEKAKIRAKLDLLAIDGKFAHVVDYKTGREWPEHKEQLSLYSTLILHLLPNLKGVIAQDWYLDLGSHVQHLFAREDHAERKAYWKERVSALLDRRIWPAKRNPFCKTCPFHVKRGGPCREGA